jgi:hypothetical protein
MGTERFREDVSESLRKYVKSNSGQKPEQLKVNFRDAMAWHERESSGLSVQDFVEKDVKSYVNSIPFQKSVLNCSVKLLGVDDESSTRFE